jgi:hypothetical protein
MEPVTDSGHLKGKSSFRRAPSADFGHFKEKSSFKIYMLKFFEDKKKQRKTDGLWRTAYAYEVVFLRKTADGYEIKKSFFSEKRCALGFSFLLVNAYEAGFPLC